MVEKARADQSQRARWLVPFTFAATAMLVVAAVVVPWTPWTDDDFGHAPWWVWGPLVAAAVLLVAGLGERKYTAWAAAAGGAALVAGVVSFLAWPREEVVVDGRRDDQIPPVVGVPSDAWHRLYAAEPPAAPLACALAAAMVLVLCVVMLVRRQRPRTAPETEPDSIPGPEEDERPYPTGAGLRRTRRAMAAGLAGVLVGGLLGVGTAFGASGLQQERMEALGPWWGQLADSAPVPEDRLDEGAVEWDEEKKLVGLPERPTRVAWQHGFAGPVALSTCGRGGRARATLVALEESAERSVIVGHDARDGTLRWSLTVHRQETAGLSQVAVDEGCSMLVLIGTVLLAVDTYTGKVEGSSLLPRTDVDVWHFMTPGPEEYPYPRLVGLNEAEYAHLTAYTGRIMAVRRSDAEPVAWIYRQSGCGYHVDYRRHDDPESSGQLLMKGCGDPLPAAVAVLPGLTPPEELRTERPAAYRLPPLQPLLASAEIPVPAPPPGCSSRFLRIRSASSIATLVETEMDCDGKKHRARISLQSNDLAGPQDWEMSPDADTAPDFTFVRSEGLYDLLEVRGDTVTRLSGARFSARWTAVPRQGDPVVGLADSDVHRRLDGWQGGLNDAGVYSPILALTRSGTLVALADFDWTSKETPQRVQVIASSDVAQQTCDGERGLLADNASGTALVLCTSNEGTHVTAVTD